MKPVLTTSLVASFLAYLSACTSAVEVDVAKRKSAAAGLDPVAVTLSLDSAPNSLPVKVIARFDMSIESLVSDAVSVTGGKVAAITGSGTTFEVTVDAEADGTIELSIPEGSVTAINGAANAASNVLTVNVDTSRPTTLLETATAETVTTSPLAFQVTFSEAVTGFDLTDVVIENGTAEALDGSEKTYAFQVVPAGAGPLTVSVAEGAATDAAGNLSLASAAIERTYSSSRPTAVLTTGAATTSASPFSVTVTFSKIVTGFVAADLAVTNAVLSNFTGSGKSYSFDLTPSAEGPVTVDLADAVAFDAAASANTAAAQLVVTYDATPPSAALASSATSPGNANPIVFTATFSESVVGLSLSDFVVANGVANGLTGSGASYTVQITPSASGNVTVSLPSASVTDAAGNANTAAAPVTKVFDGTAPSVTLTSTAGATVAAPFAVTATFSESVTGLTLADIGVANGTAGNLAGSGTSYTFDITPLASGTVTVSLAADAAVDAVGNGSTAATPLSRAYDSSLQTVVLTTAASNPTKDSPFSVTATFSAAMTGFVVGDITVGNGTAGNFAGANAVYTFDVTPAGQGDVTIDIAGGVAVDASSVTNAAATRLTRTFDSTAPTVALTSAAAATLNTAFSVTATFSESVTGFAVGDVTVANGTAGNFAGSGTTYTFDVTPTADGAVTVDVSSAVAADGAGNGNTAAAQLSRTYDTAQPTVTLTSTATSSTNLSPFTVTATFSSAVTGFALGDLVVGNGTASTLAGSGTTYTFAITPTAPGTVSVDLPSNSAINAIGNSNAAAAQFTRTYDNAGPTVSLTSAAAATVNAAFSVTATFSESVANFVVGDVTVVGGSASNLAGSGTTYTFDVTPSGAATVTVDIASAVASDAAGNDNSAASQLSRAYDATEPTISISSAEPTTTRNSSIAVTVTTSESTTNFAVGDLTLTNATVSGFSGSGTSYSFTLTPTAEGVARVDVNAGAFTDAAGNGNVAATQFSRTYDITAPTAPTSPTCSGGDNSVAVGWTTGGGDTAGFLLVRTYGSDPTWTPTDGVAYSDATTNSLDNYTHWLAYAGASTSATETYVFPGMPHHYAIFAYDSVYNYQSAVTTNCAPLPLAMLENLPAATFSGSALDVKVGGHGVTQYQYALTTPNFYCDEVSYSAWTGVATKITDAVVRGHYRLCVKGKTAGGAEQTVASEYYFLKPAHTSIDWPSRWNAKVQVGDDFRIRWEDHDASDNVSGTLTFYYASSTAADCSGATLIPGTVSQDTASKWKIWDTDGVSLGTYYICVESYDGSSTVSYWAEGTVTVEDYCTGAKLTNTLSSGDNGAGTMGDPYNICTLDQLNLIRSTTQTSKYFQLRRDIDASATSSWNSGAGWLSFTFTGDKLDGNGYVIRGLYQVKSTGTSGNGLISQATNSASIITRMRLEDVSITATGTPSTGALVGICHATVEQSYVSGSVSGSSDVGGIVGILRQTGVLRQSRSAAAVVTNSGGAGGVVGNLYESGQLSKSWFSGSINTSCSSSCGTGGIAGKSATNTITSVLTTGTVNGSAGSWLGGVIGYTNPSATLSLRRAVFSGSITMPGSHVGGIIGRSDSTVSAIGCVSSGSISGSGNVGGISATSLLRLVGSIFNGSLVNAGNVTGGLFAGNMQPKGVLLASYVTGSVTGVDNVGGLFGGTNASSNTYLIRSTAVSGSVTCSGTVCGGAIGYLLGSGAALIDSYSAATVTLTNGGTTGTAGGLVSNFGTANFIRNSYATGDVNNSSGQTRSAGGLGGFGTGTVSNSFSTGTVTATNAGGLWFQRSAGALVFSGTYWYKPGGNTQNCVYSDAVPTSTNCSSNSSLAYFQDSANAPLSSWDFVTMWKVASSGFPKLSWQHD